MISKLFIMFCIMFKPINALSQVPPGVYGHQYQVKPYGERLARGEQVTLRGLFE